MVCREELPGDGIELNDNSFLLWKRGVAFLFRQEIIQVNLQLNAP